MTHHQRAPSSAASSAGAFPSFEGYTFQLVPRPPESALKPEPPGWLTAMVEAGKKELGKGKRYATFMQIPGAHEWAFYNRHARRPPMGPTDETLARIVEKKFGQGLSTVEIAKQEGEGYQTMKRWMQLAEQRGLIDAHQRRVTTELGPLAIEALTDALKAGVDIRTRVKAAVAVQSTLEKLNTHVSRKEERIEERQKEDTLDDIIARMRQQRAKAMAKQQLVEEYAPATTDQGSDHDTIDAEFHDHGVDPERTQRPTYGLPRGPAPRDERGGGLGRALDLVSPSSLHVTDLAGGAEKSGPEGGEEVVETGESGSPTGQ